MAHSRHGLARFVILPPLKIQAREPEIPRGPDTRVSHLAIAPDGHGLAVAVEDGSFRVWDQRFQFRSPHPGASSVFCDGHLAFLAEATHAMQLEPMFTRSGGELIGGTP